MKNKSVISLDLGSLISGSKVVYIEILIFIINNTCSTVVNLKKD